MEKQVYNFEALTKIRKKREKNRRIKMIMAAICIVAVLIVLYILSSSRCEYYVYKDKTDTEDNVDVSYETFADGYLKYSSNGIEFQKKFGRSEWNVALSYVHPFFTKSDSYAVLGDKGENSLILFNKNGKVKELTLKYPLVQATVSDQGIIEVILEGTNSNYTGLCKEWRVDSRYAFFCRGDRLSCNSGYFSRWYTACGKLLFYFRNEFKNIYCVL